MRQEQTINIDMGGEKGGSKRGLTFWRPNTRPIFYPSVCRLRIAVWKHSALGRGCFRFNVCWWKNDAKERKMAVKESTELAVSCVWSIRCPYCRVSGSSLRSALLLAQNLPAKTVVPGSQALSTRLDSTGKSGIVTERAL